MAAAEMSLAAGAGGTTLLSWSTVGGLATQQGLSLAVASAPTIAATGGFGLVLTSTSALGLGEAASMDYPAVGQTLVQAGQIGQFSGLILYGAGLESGGKILPRTTPAAQTPKPLSLNAAMEGTVGEGRASITGYTWNRVLQARYGVANVEWVAPKIATNPLTLGVLKTPAGEFELASGWNGYGGMMPKGAPGFDIVTRTHVEGQAAALMQRQGISEGMLYMNNPAMCPSCTRNLPYMLGPGRILQVYPLDGSPVPVTGVAR